MAKMKAILAVITCAVMVACGGGSSGGADGAGAGGPHGGSVGGGVEPIELTGLAEGEQWLEVNFDKYKGDGLVVTINDKDFAIPKGQLQVKYALKVGDEYKVTVKTGASTPTQDCTAAGATGFGSEQISSVYVTCELGVRFVFSSRSIQSSITPYRWTADDSFLASGNLTGGGDAHAYAAKFARHPSKRVIYSVTPTHLTALAVDEKDATLSELNMTPWDGSHSFGNDILVHPNGKYLYVSAGTSVRGYQLEDNGALMLDYASQPIDSLGTVEGMTMNVGAITPDDVSYIYAWSAAGKLEMLALDKDGKLSSHFPTAALGVITQRIVFHPNGRFAVSTDGSDQKLTVWQVNANLLQNPAHTASAAGFNPKEIAFNPDGAGTLYMVSHSFTGPNVSDYSRWRFNGSNGALTHAGNFQHPGYGSIAGIHPHTHDLMILENNVAFRIKGANDSSSWGASMLSPTGSVIDTTSLFLY